MNSITSTKTIEKLQLIFSTHGLPCTIVTDNGLSFTSIEFKSFCQINSIRHITSSTYYIATIGFAKRSVQSFKQGMMRMEGGSLHSKLSRFLFCY